MEYYKSHTIIGNKLGRQIGTPTLNLHLHKPLNIEFGVYVFEVLLFSKHYFAVGTYGVRDSIDSKLTLEVHLLDAKFLQNELYYVKIEVHALHFLRSMQKFDGLDSLKCQLELDKQLAFEYVKNLTKTTS